MSFRSVEGDDTLDPSIHLPDGLRGSYKLKGHCPMGCGETLFMASGGHITCSDISCPLPTVVDELLSENETGHIVLIDDGGFTIKHPLCERALQHRLGHGELFKCALLKYMNNLTGPPAKPGYYRVLQRDDLTWQFMEVTENG
jgi:hypothetical protein